MLGTRSLVADETLHSSIKMFANELQGRSLLIIQRTLKFSSNCLHHISQSKAVGNDLADIPGFS